MLQRLYDRARRRLGDSAAKRVLRSLGLTRPARALYERGILKRGEMEALIVGRALRFRVSSQQEILSIETLYSEDEFFSRILADLRPDDVLFDVGANIGLLTLVAAKEHPTLRVHSFEPEPRNADRLAENIALNRLTNVCLHRVALGAARGKARLFLDGGMGSGLHSLEPCKGEELPAIEISITTGTEVVHDTGAAPTVMKIDVEGAEMGVLLGCEPLLGPGGARELFIEAHAHGKATATEIRAWLEARGYRLVWSSKRVLEELQHYRFAS